MNPRTLLVAYPCATRQPNSLNNACHGLVDRIRSDITHDARYADGTWDTMVAAVATLDGPVLLKQSRFAVTANVPTMDQARKVG